MELTLGLTQPDHISVTCDGQYSHIFSLRGLLPEQAPGQVVLKDPVDTGRRLFAALFSEGSLASQTLQSHPKRILLVTEDAQLDNISWEYLYGPRGLLVKDLTCVVINQFLSPSNLCDMLRFACATCSGLCMQVRSQFG